MISSSLAYFLLLGSLAFFAWLGYKESLKIEIDQDSFQSGGCCHDKGVNTSPANSFRFLLLRRLGNYG